MFDYKRLFKKKQPEHPEEQRHAVADWAMNILILLFGTTTLVQAFVVPTASMETTIMIGDHMFVDKLAYSPASGIGKMLLPYSEVKRGDVIVFRYPLNIAMNYVKRCIGVPGDHLKIVTRPFTSTASHWLRSTSSTSLIANRPLTLTTSRWIPRWRPLSVCMTVPAI